MAGKKGASRLGLILLFPFLILGGLVFPFILLVRLSVTLSVSGGLNPWLSLLISAIVTLGLLFFALNWLSRKWSGKKKIKPSVKGRNLKIAFALTALIGVYSLFFAAGGSARTEDVKEEYTSLHPLMRMATGILVLADRDAVITDMARSHGDYTRMGLAEKKKSLHFVQTDGYVHAVDFRTQGRAEWKNKITALYFNLLGFNTLRHVGTADHLHVALSHPGVSGI